MQDLVIKTGANIPYLLSDNEEKNIIVRVGVQPSDEIRKDFEKAISLQVIDNYWMEHINTMDHLREGVSLRGYANEDPLQAYIREGFELFDKMLDNICKDTTLYLLKAEIRQNLQVKQVKGSTNEAKDQGVKKTIKKGKKIGRNDMCPCGSGRKYKQCCGK